jgi:hypothetical protein
MPGASGDWVGVFSPTAAYNYPWVWAGAAATSYTWLTNANFPTSKVYEFRIYNSSNQLRMKSNYFWVQDPNLPPNPDACGGPAPTPTPTPVPSDGPLLYDYSNVSWNCDASAYPNLSNPPQNNCMSPQYDVIQWPVNGQVGYVTAQAPGPLPLNGKIRFKFTLNGGPIRGGDGTNLSNVSIFIQRSGDNWSGAGGYNCYRLWGYGTLALTNKVGGQYTLEARLNGTSAGLGGVMTGCSDSQVQGTLQNPVVIGFTFGDSQSKGHGTVASSTNIRVDEYKVFGPQ